MNKSLQKLEFSENAYMLQALRYNGDSDSFRIEPMLGRGS